jgi:hypothetical protein
MTVLDVLRLLVGPIRPTCDQAIDDQRFENLKQMMAVVDSLLEEISSVADMKDAHAWSIERAAKAADEYIKSVGWSE